MLIFLLIMVIAGIVGGIAKYVYREKGGKS